ncbi:hypothetical protein H5410_002618 [Solanum commersonii]|uniref:BED-type domain-containing protein n=1 Tax=Solanum commersonii TaxID=4109 RepID=A0A9J6B2B1_SOLCO|nr:hypothetical protein H5410_002618 [Solanum commersonii]
MGHDFTPVTQAFGEATTTTPVTQARTQVFGESIMDENIIIDKVVGESGASNSNSISQTQTIESKVKKERKKRSRAWDHFTRKTDHARNEKGVCNYC